MGVNWWEIARQIDEEVAKLRVDENTKRELESWLSDVLKEVIREREEIMKQALSNYTKSGPEIRNAWMLWTPKLEFVQQMNEWRSNVVKRISDEWRKKFPNLPPPAPGTGFWFLITNNPRFVMENMRSVLQQYVYREPVVIKDSLGRVVEVRYPGGGVLKYTYFDTPAVSPPPPPPQPNFEVVLSRDSKGRPTLVQTPWGQLAIDYADWWQRSPSPLPKPDFEVVLSRDSKGRPTLVQTPYGQLAIDYADNWTPPPQKLELTTPQPKVESKPSLGPPEIKLDAIRLPPNAQKPPQSPVKIEPPPVTPPPPPPPTALEDRLEEALKRVEQQRERERQLMERFETVKMALKTELPNRIRALPEVAPQPPNLKKPTPLPAKA
jgi:hypothetical protein